MLVFNRILDCIENILGIVKYKGNHNILYIDLNILYGHEILDISIGKISWMFCIVWIRYNTYIIYLSWKYANKIKILWLAKFKQNMLISYVRK